MNPRTTHSAAIGIAALAGLAWPAAAQQYQLVDLGALTAWTTPASINASGVVAGWSMQADSAFRAVLWDGSLNNLGPVAGSTQSTATAITDDGTVFGIAYSLGDPIGKAVRFNGAITTVLGEFAPRGANNAGDVVGRAQNTTADGLLASRACLWHAGTLSLLPTLGGQFSDAFDINASGWIAGSSYATGDRIQRPVLWVAGAPIDLGTLSGTASSFGQAKALNDSGSVVGWSSNAAGVARATLFRTNASGVVTSRVDLGTLAAGASSFAAAINASEQIVGTSNWRAFLWSGGTMTDLNSRIAASGWELQTAAAINDSGRIVGTGAFNGTPRAFLLIPRCNLADVAGLGGTSGADGALTPDDIVLFLAAFFSGDTAVADVGSLGGAAQPDGQLTVDDIVVFLAAFFAGCA